MPLCPQVSRSSRAWDQKFSSWSGSVPSCPTVNLEGGGGHRSANQREEHPAGLTHRRGLETDGSCWLADMCSDNTHTSIRCEWGRGQRSPGEGLCWRSGGVTEDGVCVGGVKGQKFQFGTWCQWLDRWADYRLCRQRHTAVTAVSSLLATPTRLNKER